MLSTVYGSIASQYVVQLQLESHAWISCWSPQHNAPKCKISFSYPRKFLIRSLRNSEWLIICDFPSYELSTGKMMYWPYSLYIYTMCSTCIFSFYMLSRFSCHRFLSLFQGVLHAKRVSPQQIDTQATSSRKQSLSARCILKFTQKQWKIERKKVCLSSLQNALAAIIRLYYQRRIRAVSEVEPGSWQRHTRKRSCITRITKKRGGGVTPEDYRSCAVPSRRANSSCMYMFPLEIHSTQPLLLNGVRCRQFCAEGRKRDARRSFLIRHIWILDTIQISYAYNVHQSLSNIRKNRMVQNTCKTRKCRWRLNRYMAL